MAKKSFKLNKDNRQKDDSFFGDEGGFHTPRSTIEGAEEAESIWQDFGSKDKDTTEKSTGTIPVSSGIESPKYAKKRPILTGLRSLREKVFGSKRATPDEENVRKDLIKISNQMVVTQSIIESNTDILSNVAKDNIQVAELLKRLQDPEQSRIREKTIKGEELFPEELAQLISYMENVTKGISEVGVGLSYSFPELIKNTQQMINDNRLDIGNRRDLVKSLVKILNENKIQTNSTSELKGINLEILNFTKEESAVLNEILSDLQNETVDKKLTGSLSDISKKMGATLLTTKSLADFLGKKDSTDKTNKESLLSRGLGALPGGARSGILNTAFSALGLPGLGTILGGLSEFSSIGRLLGKGLGKGAGALGSVLGGTAKGVFDSKSIAAAAGAALPLLLAGTAGIALGSLLVDYLDKITGGKYSSFVGTPGAKLAEWMNPEKEDVATGQKQVLKGNPQFQKYMMATGGKGSEDEFLRLLESDPGKLKAIINPINTSMKVQGMQEYATLAKPETSPASLDTSSFSTSKEREDKKTEDMSKMAASAGKPVVINVPSKDKQTTPSLRKTVIDDFYLSSMNTGIFE